MGIPKRNKSGCLDLTAKEAIDRAILTDKRLKITEAQEQTRLFEWAAWNEKKYPDLKYLFHVPNGGSRNKAEAKNFKRQGVKSGVPDIYLDVARHGYHGLRIELKAIGGKLSDNQANWLNRLKEQGYFAVDAQGFEEAKDYILWYLGGKNDANTD